MFTNLKCIHEFYVFTNLKCIHEFYVFTNLCALVLRIEFKFKMANGSNGQRAEYENRERYFLEVVDLLDECERVWTMHNASSSVKEYLEIQLELLILSLQHLLPLVGRDNRNVFREVLRNVCIFHDTWKRTNPHSPTDVAIYTLEGPPVFQCGAVGRPRLHISEDVLLNLRSFGFTWEKISEMLLVLSRRRVVEFGLDQTTGFSEISNEQLDTIVTQFLTNHGNLVGYSIVSGHLRSLGLRVQRDRIRESIRRVDSRNSRIRWAVIVSRRSYSVAGPNSLWHIDGHHSLISWGFVIHGGIDGFSRLVVYLQCATNNKSETVGELFLLATEKYEWPSRVRSDYGGENVVVWELMEERRGSNRGSYLVGSSTQNQRIERLWRDVFRTVAHIFYYTFQSMEEAGHTILDRNNNLHLFCLHFIFLLRINRALESFVEAWNLHPIRTERNWSPVQMWTNGMIDLRNQSLTAVADVVGYSGSADDLEWYGYDPQAPHPNDDGLSTVLVDNVNFDVSEELENQLSYINPLAESNNFGIDLHEEVIEIVISNYYQ